MPQPIKPKDILTIGDVAERTGLTVSAIRFYEEQQLVTPHRNAGGQRRFMRSDIRRLSFVMIAQQFGFPIAEIRQLLAGLPSGRTPNKRDWTRISRRIRERLEARIDTLTQLRDNLDGCIGCGCLSLERCRLHNRDDSAFGLGQGPRYLLGNRPGDLDRL